MGSSGVAVAGAGLVAVPVVVELERILNYRILDFRKNPDHIPYNLVTDRIARDPGTRKGRCLLAVLGHHSSWAIPGVTQHVPG